MIERLYGFDQDIIEQVPKSKAPAKYRRDGVRYVFKYNGVLIPNIVCADGLKYNYSFGREDDPKEDLFDWS
jgi:hypothetical protein